MSEYVFTRREVLAALTSDAALPLVSACGGDRAASSSASSSATSTSGTPTEASGLALLNEVAENLLQLSPESATSLGIDTGTRAALRSQLGDRSQAGRQRVAQQLKT